MNIDLQVMEVLRRHAPGLLHEPVENSDERRRELRNQLASVESEDLERVRAREAEVKANEALQAELKARLEAAEQDEAKARNELSEARERYTLRRDTTWKALAEIPSAPLAAFRQEVEGRLADVGLWSRTWPDKFDKNIGAVTSTGNARSLDAYAQALIRTKSLVVNAIHQGLEGVDAETAIAGMRAAWPQVQVGPKEYVSPTWQG